MSFIRRTVANLLSERLVSALVCLWSLRQALRPFDYAQENQAQDTAQDATQDVP